MSIVLSSNVRLIVCTQDTTVFTTSNSTELSITKDITLDRSNIVNSATRARVSKTPNRVPVSKQEGYSSVSLGFKTYIKPLTDTNVVSSEKLLWQSLSNTNTVDTATDSTIRFTTNSNKLTELFIYLVFDDGSYYKISNAVVKQATISLNLNEISSVDWSLEALDYTYVKTGNLTGTTKDYKTKTFINNKMSTISLTYNTNTYTLALMEGTITITNSLVTYGRSKVNKLTRPTGHYVTDRITSVSIKCYLNNINNGTADLLTVLNKSATLDAANSTANIIISIGGATSSRRVDVSIPYGILEASSPTIGQLNTISIKVTPQESSIGAGDEINLVYKN